MQADSSEPGLAAAESGDGASPAADFSALLPDVSRRLESLAPELGGIDYMREKHLELALRDAVNDAGIAFAVKNKKIAIPEWSTPPRVVGRVDIAVSPSSAQTRFSLLAETKWCQFGDDKVYEAIWDLFKMALATTRVDRPEAYLVTAATTDIWKTAFCADLLGSGVVSTEELCTRRFPSGSQRLAWDYLLEGGYDRYPESVPARISTVLVGSTFIQGGDRTWEVRAVRVVPQTDFNVPLEGGWPWGKRPPDARRPLAVDLV
jgi:hypothetical protein